MKVFKMDLRIPKDRADGRPGFVKVKRGDTPEQHGFTPEQVEELAPLLMDGEGAITIPTHEQIVDAFYRLNPEDKTLWTADGRPRVKAIEKILEHDITETQRDEAWANYEKEGDNK